MEFIYYFSAEGKTFFSDPTVRLLVNSHHAWQAPNSTWSYGVIHPGPNVHPLQLVDALTALGVAVLGSATEAMPVPATVIAALAAHGVKEGDDGHAVAVKMSTASTIKHFRPHRLGLSQ